MPPKYLSRGTNGVSLLRQIPFATWKKSEAPSKLFIMEKGILMVRYQWFLKQSFLCIPSLENIGKPFRNSLQSPRNFRLLPLLPFSISIIREDERERLREEFRDSKHGFSNKLCAAVQSTYFL